MHDSLKHGCSPCAESDHTEKQSQGEKPLLLGIQSKLQTVSERNRNCPYRGDRETDRGERRAERQVQAGLQSVISRRLDCCSRFRQQNQQSDDNADD